MGEYRHQIRNASLPLGRGMVALECGVRQTCSPAQRLLHSSTRLIRKYHALTMADVFQLAIDAFASSDRTTMLAASEKFDSLNSGAGGCPLPYSKHTFLLMR